MSITALQQAIRTKKTPIALGLKPDIEKISPKIRQNFTEMFGPGPMADAEALRYHGTQALTDAGDKLPAVVLHAASYLRYGMMGADVLWNLISAAKSRGLYVILDIATDSPEAWWSSGVDAVTVDPYLYSPSEVPADRAVFAIVRTDCEAQTLRAGDRPLYTAIAERMARSGAALVVSTGYSLDIREVRRRCEKAFFLLPKCDEENAFPAFDDYGHGAMVVDYALQYSGGVDEAIARMKREVAVL